MEYLVIECAQNFSVLNTPYLSMMHCLRIAHCNCLYLSRCNWSSFAYHCSMDGWVGL